MASRLRLDKLYRCVQLADTGRSAVILFFVPKILFIAQNAVSCINRRPLKVKTSGSLLHRTLNLKNIIICVRSARILTKKGRKLLDLGYQVKRVLTDTCLITNA